MSIICGFVRKDGSRCPSRRLQGRQRCGLHDEVIQSRRPKTYKRQEAEPGPARLFWAKWSARELRAELAGGRRLVVFEDSGLWAWRIESGGRVVRSSRRRYLSGELAKEAVIVAAEQGVIR